MDFFFLKQGFLKTFFKKASEVISNIYVYVFICLFKHVNIELHIEHLEIMSLM